MNSNRIGIKLNSQLYRYSYYCTAYKPYQRK